MFGCKKKTDIESISSFEYDMDWVKVQMDRIETDRYSLRLRSENGNQGNFYHLLKELGQIPDLCHYHDHWSIVLMSTDDKHDYYIALRCETFKQALVYYTEIVEDLQNDERS